MKMLIALDLDRLIGRSDGSLPWRLPGDLARFQRLTMGGDLIVGRTTAETLPPLKGRRVLTASMKCLASDLKSLCDDYPSAWICGGAQIYRAALELGVVTEVYATRVYQHGAVQMRTYAERTGQVFAPQWEQDFTLTSVELGVDRNTCYEHWRAVRFGEATSAGTFGVKREP